MSSALSHFVTSTHDERTEISREKALKESRLLKRGFRLFLLNPFFFLILTPFPVEARWPPPGNQSHEEVPYTAPRRLSQVNYDPSCFLRYRLTFSWTGTTNCAARSAHMHIGCLSFPLRTPSELKWSPSYCLNYTTWGSSIPPPSFPRSKIN